MITRKIDTTRQIEKAAKKSAAEKYVLKLYITGLTPKSTKAIIDIYKQPVLAKGEQIIAASTLIKKLPLPLRTLISDMSNTERMLVGLDLRLKVNAKERS